MVSEPVNYFLLLRSMHESSGTEEELPMSDVASKILRNSVSALFSLDGSGVFVKCHAVNLEAHGMIRKQVQMLRAAAWRSDA